MNLNAIMGYMMPVLFMIFIVNGLHSLYRQRQLMNYLEQNHNEQWRYLTSIGSFGPGMVNSARSLPYLFEDTDNSDPEILRLKLLVRRSLYRTIGIFVAMPVIAIAMATYCAATGRW